MFHISSFVCRYMEDLQDLYYYPIAVVVASAVGSVGFKIYAIFAVRPSRNHAYRRLYFMVISPDRLRSYQYFYMLLSLRKLLNWAFSV